MNTQTSMCRRGIWLACLSLAVAGATSVVHAADGALDPAFGVNGLVRTDFAGLQDQANAIAVDASGRSIVAGRVAGAGASRFALARYTAAGVLDTTFGSGGRVITAIGDDSSAFAITLDAQGRIVVAGTSTVKRGGFYVTDFAVARYDVNGTLDATFDGDGVAVTDVGGFGLPTAIAIDGTGRIVVGGSTLTPWGFTVARYNPDGSLDTAFGTGGLVTTTARDEARAAGLAIDALGRIVLAGYASDDLDVDVMLARYKDDGSLDASFGTGGVALIDLGGIAQADAVAIDAHGRIVVAGVRAAAPGQPVDAMVARVTPDGLLDPSFAGTGWAITDFGGFYDRARAVAIAANGKIVVAGRGGNDLAPDFAIARYTLDGTLDATFGLGGRVATDFGTNDGDSPAGLAIDPAGWLVAAGSCWGATAEDFCLARYAVVMHPPADLNISASVDKPNTVNQGDLLTYTIGFGNAGPNPARNVFVTDVLSSGTTFVGAQTTKGNVATPPAGQTGVVTWSLGDVVRGTATQAKLTVTVKVRGKTTVTNSAAIVSDSLDPSPSNNATSITTKVGAGNRR
jgi:uncharacterized delta-60 repeat protein/uncharacterized repeat protein (TIGR01451 family)